MRRTGRAMAWNNGPVSSVGTTASVTRAANARSEINPWSDQGLRRDAENPLD